jgi:hypothetical protein
LQDHQFLVSRPPLPKEGPLPADLASAASKAPEAEENQDGNDAEESEENTSSTTRILVLTGRGSVSKSLLLRVPPFRELRPVKPLFEKMI